jgi:hypothetical protein
MRAPPDKRRGPAVTPGPVAGHLARLQATPAGTGMLQDGWEVAMVDLERVVAFQPLVFTDTAVERVAGVAPDDLGAIAELTLPVNHTAPIVAQYDQLKQAYTFTSPDPNLKVLGNFNGPVPQANGMHGFGFLVGVAPSFLQVVRFQDRYVLRDGYHRSFGLLSRGFSRVPAFIRDFDTLENLAPAGMLPQSAWLGPRPRCCATTTTTWSRSRSAGRRSARWSSSRRWSCRPRVNTTGNRRPVPAHPPSNDLHHHRNCSLPSRSATCATTTWSPWNLRGSR